MLFPKEPEKICPPHTKEKPCPQAAVCGARPPHKYGRPGELLSCDARGTTHRPFILSCRRQFSADPQLAPGFLKGPAGPLSRAAAASKLLRGSIRKQSGKTLSARRVCHASQFLQNLCFLMSLALGRLSCFLLSATKEGRPRKSCRLPKASHPNHATGYQIKICNSSSLQNAACPPKSIASRRLPTIPNFKKSQKSLPPTPQNPSFPPRKPFQNRKKRQNCICALFIVRFLCYNFSIDAMNQTGKGRKGRNG